MSNTSFYDYDEGLREVLDNLGLGNRIVTLIINLKELAFECGYQQALLDIKDKKKK